MKKPFFKLIKYVLMCLLFLTVIPTQVLAEGENSYAYSEDAGGNKTYYYSVNDAMNATRKNYTVYMTRDWELSSPLNIVEGTTSRINLNGYTIKRTDMPSSLSHSGEVITLHANSKLYLYGSANDVEFSKYGIKSGGFVSGGCTYNGGGIYMKKGAYLYLKRVAVVDNYALNEGGGVYAGDDNCSIELYDAKISYNSTSKLGGGGGIASAGEKFGMNLAERSEISYNSTFGIGAGVYCAYSDVTIGSTDETGKIINNAAVGRGGGIYLNKGTCSITDLTIDGNSGTDAGGIFCRSSNVYLKNLTITNNKTNNNNGGGVLINYKGVYLKDCKIYNNHAANLGGGVFMVADYDINLRGCNKIYDNTSGNSNVKDDLYLANRNFYKAYVIGDDFDANSKIGIRTPSTSDRLIAKNITGVQYVSAFFLDEAEDYHIGFETNDNEIWQRTGATTYAVKVNGTPAGKYAKGTENITVVDNNTDTTKVFVSWDENSVSSLDLNPEDLTSETISFTMPGEEVNLVSNYAAAVNKLTLSMDGVVENQALPTSATLSWVFNDNPGSEEVILNWYKKDDGRYINCGNEVATAGTAYVFEVCAEGKQDKTHVISSAITKDDVTINDGTIKVNELSLNDEGILNFKSEDIIVGKDVISYVDPVIVSVREGASKQDVVSSVNDKIASIVSTKNATSKNGYEYYVGLNDISETDLNSEWFNDNGIIKNANGYYSMNIGVSNSDDVDLTTNNITNTMLVINVLAKDQETDKLKVYRINDATSSNENEWYVEIALPENCESYQINDQEPLANADGKATLTGIKNERKIYYLMIVEYNGTTDEYIYILDDSKPSKPVFQTGESGKNDNGELYRQIITDYYANDDLKPSLYYVYNVDGKNTWTIKKQFSDVISTGVDSYKTVKVFAWAVNEYNDMSDISSKLYTLDNYNRISFNGTFISKVDVTINNLVYGQNLPTAIKKIDVTLSGNKVDSFENLPITEWLPTNTNVLNNTVYQAKIKLNTSVKYSVDYLSTLHIVVNKDENIYAYIEKENGEAILNIIFPELESSRGGYDLDKTLSYTLNSIEIGDYTTSLSYEKACELNNDLSKLDLPYILLNVKNNNSGEQEIFRLDSSNILKFASSFDPNNSNDQQIILKANIADLIPSYVNHDGIDTSVTLTINVTGRDTSANKAISCEEYMNSKNWTWSEVKKACVYRVSNTSSK